MGIDGVFHYFNLTLEVFFLDILLSGDNAVVIALACRSLPMAQKRRAMLIGTFIAIALRMLLTLIASTVLQVPVLKLLGGIALMVIAIQLTLGDQDDDANADGSEPHGSAHTELLPIIGTLILADLVMSMDNVIALAAVAKGSMLVLVLALGLLLSVPILMFGSWYVTRLLQSYPVLTRLGGAMLGWFAGDIAVSDPLYASWIEHQSPALSVLVPALCAVFVLLQSRIIEQSRDGAAALRPKPRVKVAVATVSVTAPLIVETPVAVVVPEAAAMPECEPELVAPLEPALLPLADAVPVSAPDADPPDGPISKQSSRAIRLLKILGVISGIVTVIGIGSAYVFLKSRWMPVPIQPIQYDCLSRDISIFYKRGTNAMRMTSGAASVEALVFYDNQIEWRNYKEATAILGFEPPTKMLYADKKTIRLDGGMFDKTACAAH